MSDRRDLTTRALPLRTVDYSESDLIVTLLTEHFGKRVLFASAGRKSRRRFFGALEPFRLSEVRFREGQQDNLAQLVEARVLEAFSTIPSDLHKLCWATLAMELTAELIREQAVATAAFPTAVRYLAWLDQESRDPWYTETGTLRYCLVLLAHEGLLPAFGRCARTGTPLEQIEQPLFSTTAGGLLAPPAVRPEDHAAVVPLETLELLATLVKGHFPTTRNLAALQSAREIVISAAQNALEKELKSLKLLKTMWLGATGS
ncbi:MAG: DNA repair protein RecO [Bradymonadales bacterium]|nr:DNA repair protein RecO [Bradymonadales bacterium]